MAEPPAVASSHDVTVLHDDGVSLFAEISGLRQSWPDTSGSTGAVIILSVGTLPDVPSSTLLKFLDGRRKALSAPGNRFMLVGVQPKITDLVRRTGILDDVDAATIYPARPEVFGALNDAVAQAHHWIAQRHQ